MIQVHPVFPSSHRLMGTEEGHTPGAFLSGEALLAELRSTSYYSD